MNNIWKIIWRIILGICTVIVSFYALTLGGIFFFIVLPGAHSYADTVCFIVQFSLIAALILGIYKSTKGSLKTISVGVIISLLFFMKLYTLVSYLLSDKWSIEDFFVVYLPGIIVLACCIWGLNEFWWKCHREYFIQRRKQILLKMFLLSALPYTLMMNIFVLFSPAYFDLAIAKIVIYLPLGSYSCVLSIFLLMYIIIKMMSIYFPQKNNE